MKMYLKGRFFKKTPLTITSINLKGLIYVAFCSQIGIVSIGVPKPDKITDTEIKTKVPRRACCWVLQSDDKNKPNPTTDQTKTNNEKYKSIIEPLKGISNKNMAAKRMTEPSDIPIITPGIALPINISHEVKGDTKSWSNVPDSLSLASDKEITIIHVNIVKIATSPGTVNHL